MSSRVLTLAAAALRRAVPPGFLPRLARSLPVIAAISVATLGVEHLGWLDRFEAAGTDVFTLLQPRRDPANVVVVGITDEDYIQIFGETSPLNRQRLHDVLNAIALGRPAIIAVDLDTSAAAFREMKVEDWWPAIVWAQESIPVRHGHEVTFTEVPPLAGFPRRPQDQAGVAAFPQDADGIVRHYRRWFPRTGEGTLDSLPWKLIEIGCRLRLASYCRAAHDHSNGEEPELLLNFSGERYDFQLLPVGTLLRVSNEPGWREAGPLRGKAVLVGGFYRAARDTLVTPVGSMAGVQVMAQAVESELTGGGIRRMDRAIEFALDLLAGSILVYFNFRFSFRTAFLLSVVATPLFCSLASYIAFSSISRWVSFIPITVGVFLHEMYDHAREYQHLRSKVAREPQPTREGEVPAD